MSAILIWIHTQEAKLFHLKPTSIHVESVRYSGKAHPVESLGRNHPQSQTDEERFYRQLTLVLAKHSPNKWLLMGPGIIPKHYVRYLETHEPLLAKNVIGVERVGQMPDSEILSIGRDYLQRYYLYQAASE